MSRLLEVPCICVRVYILVLEVALAHAEQVLMLCPHMLVFLFFRVRNLHRSSALLH